MTVQVKVNVTIENIDWDDDLGYYTGKFRYYQVSPGGAPIVSKKGNINLKVQNISDDIEVVYNLVTTMVEIEDELYPAYLASPVEDSYWMKDGPTGKPPIKGKLPPGDDEITVTGGGGNSELKMKDKNTPNRQVKYAFAVQVGIDGALKWLADDPIIINDGPSRIFLPDDLAQQSAG